MQSFPTIRGNMARAAAVAAVTGFAAAPAEAFVYFSLTDGAGHTAIVAEQIVPTFSALGLDYQFFVLNVSGGGADITGFTVGVGVNPVAPQIAVGGFFNAFGPVGNANVPFLTAEGNAVAWDFLESDNRGAPLDSYAVRWQQAPGTLAIPFGFYTRFDLYSTLGPVPGTGVVDPPASSAIFTLNFDDTTILNVNPADSTTNPQIPCGDTGQPACVELSGNGFDRASFIPEPGTLALLGTGAILLGWRRRRMTA